MHREILLELDWSDAGHLTLDALGLIPGYGEVADVANAAWYAAKEEYLMAALSVVAMVPVVGDVIGKGGKIATYLAKTGSKGAGKASQVLAKQLEKHMPEIVEFMNKLRNNPKIGKHVDKMFYALQDYVNNAVENSGYGATAQGLANIAKAAKVEPVARVSIQKGDTMKDVFKKFNARRKHRSATEFAAGETEDAIAALASGDVSTTDDELERELSALFGDTEDEELERLLAAL